MLVNLLQTFDFAGRRYLVGDNPDVDPAIARKWIMDGLATADTDQRQDNAVDTAALAASGFPIVGKPIALGILGQSNEKGQLPSASKAAFPTCFQSALNPAVTSTMGYTNSLDTSFTGSWWPAFYDLMRAYGYDMQMINGAFGAMSFVEHVCGKVKAWAANTGYCQERTSRVNHYDRGYIGDVIVESGRIFRCTTGNQRYLTYRVEQFDGATPIGTTLAYVNTVGSAVTGGAKPAGFATATKGQTIADGGITWTCVSATNNIGLFTSQIFHSGLYGYGFDPLGVLAMLHDQMALKTGVVDKYVLVCNGQADTGYAGATYQQALGYARERKQGRDAATGEALLRNSSDPETLAQRLLAGADDAERRLPGSPVTSGVASRDPQMMILESGLRNDAQSVPGALSPAAAIRDTDGGRWDGDTVWDRAVGPMQFIPSTWARFASDGNADGVGDPNQVDDAALGAARYLCATGTMDSAETWRGAILAYNNSSSYVDQVASRANAYARAVEEIP